MENNELEKEVVIELPFTLQFTKELIDGQEVVDCDSLSLTHAKRVVDLLEVFENDKEIFKDEMELQLGNFQTGVYKLKITPGQYGVLRQLCKNAEIQEEMVDEEENEL